MPETDHLPENRTPGSRRIRIETPDVDAIVASISDPAPCGGKESRNPLRRVRLRRIVQLFRQRLQVTFRRQYPFDVPPPGRSAAAAGRPQKKEDSVPVYSGCPYSDFSLLAEGGEGRIDSACDDQLQRIIAVKSLKSERCCDDAARERFRREAVLTARLSHPGIVPVYALYQDPGGGLHSVMKLIDGEPLSRYLRHLAEIYRKLGTEHFDEGRALRERLNYFLQICSAVAFAHEEERIIHRDIKPENVMLGRFDQVYVMDWGVACPIDENDAEGHVEHVMGTPAYLAPETLLEKVQNVKTDVYALGLTLFEIVFLKQAFPGNGTKEVVKNILDNRRRAPFHLCGAAVDRELKAIIAKASAYYPHERYGSVRELADDLKNYLAGRETKAAPDSWFRSITRWNRLHRHAAATIALLTLIAALIFGGALFARAAAQKSRRENEMRLLSTAYADCAGEAHRTDLFFYQQMLVLKDFARDAEFLKKVTATDGKAPSPEALLQQRLKELLLQSKEKLSCSPALRAELLLEPGTFLQEPPPAPAPAPAAGKPDCRPAWYGKALRHPDEVTMTRCRSEEPHGEVTTRLAVSLPGGRGAASLVLSPAFLKRGMTPYQSGRGTKTVKQFVSRSGLVTTEITADAIKLLPLEPESPNARCFDDDALLSKIMQQNYGSLFHQGPRGRELVAFAYLRTLDSWYVIRTSR